MERFYYRRDRKIVVEEIENTRAVHISVDAEGALTQRCSQDASEANNRLPIQRATSTRVALV